MSIYFFHFFCWETMSWPAPADDALPLPGLFGDEL